MDKTPKGLRLHIGVFGRRNVGKSSILNALVKQNVSIVSDIPGTTTDPVEKVMELKPIGPVVFIDTAGIDDIGALGAARVKQSIGVIDRTDLAILVTDDWNEYERRLLALFNEAKIPYVVVANKSDLRRNDSVESAALAAGAKHVVTTCAVDREGMEQFRQAVISAAPPEYLEETPVIGDLLKPGDVVVLVTPIDLEAPKGRLILPQVQTLRDILDHNAWAIVVKETELADALARLNQPPALVVTDSQAFQKVAQVTPLDVPLTSFSILYARFKGDLLEMVKGALAIDSLTDDDKVLIAEACSHHPVKDDIGREKIPKWLRNHTKADLKIDIVAGRDFPDDLSPYSLIIHCGGCVFNRKQLQSRIRKAVSANVSFTNYGVAIAHLHGMLPRVVAPFRINIDSVNTSAVS